MTTLQDCLQEIIENGPGYFIRSSAPLGAHEGLEWESIAVLTDIQQKSPGMLTDSAWTEWSVRPQVGRSCHVHYGIHGTSLGHQSVPGYGHLRVLEQSQRRRTATDDDILLILNRRSGY